MGSAAEARACSTRIVTGTGTTVGSVLQEGNPPSGRCTKTMVLPVLTCVAETEIAEKTRFFKFSLMYRNGIESSNIFLRRDGLMRPARSEPLRARLVSVCDWMLA